MTRHEINMRGAAMRITIVVIITAVFCAAAGCDGPRRTDVIRNALQLRGREGSRVVIEGVVSGIMWQHMAAPTSSHPRENYLDMRDLQIVVYSRKDIRCRGTVRIDGTVVKIEGSSRDPRRKEAVDEYHVIADTWECLP